MPGSMHSEATPHDLRLAPSAQYHLAQNLSCRSPTELDIGHGASSLVGNDPVQSSIPSYRWILLSKSAIAICITIGNNGDVVQARNRAYEAHNGIEIGYAVPHEGSLLWLDMVAIPKDAPHPANAHQYLN